MCNTITHLAFLQRSHATTYDRCAGSAYILECFKMLLWCSEYKMKALSIYHQGKVFQMFPNYLISEAMWKTQLLIKYINTYTSEGNIYFNPLRYIYRILTYDIQACPLQFKFKKQSDSSHPLVTSSRRFKYSPQPSVVKHIKFMFYSQD